MSHHDYKSPSLFIAGEWLNEPRSTTPVINPATGKEIGRLPSATASDVERALISADEGFAVWKKTPLDERAAIMKKAAGHLRDMMEEAVAHLVMEQGKPIAEARSELENCAILLEWCPAQAAEIQARVLPERNGFRDLRVRREPIGPIAAFSPWNFPASLAARKVASAMAVGCSAIVRPAEETPAAFAYFAKSLQMAGLPNGVLNVLYGDPEITTYPLIDSSVIRKIAFTGSTPVGCKLASRAGANAKPCVMELGGHAPIVVCGDADVDKAIALSVESKFRNAGQVCVSPTRFYVHDSIYDRFATGFVAGAEAIRVGDGMDPDTQMGPLANARRVEAVERLVQDAVSRGADLLTGGHRLNQAGCFFQPTLLGNVPAEATIMQEEPFGPVATINRFSGLDEAIAQANSTPYALGAYAFTASDATAEHLSRELDAGMVGINSYTIVFTDSPIGGRRYSGFGSEGGPEGVEAYLIPKFTSLS